MSVNETFITKVRKSVTNDKKIADTICTVRHHQYEDHMDLHGHIIIYATHTTRQVVKRIDGTRHIVGSRE